MKPKATIGLISINTSSHIIGSNKTITFANPSGKQIEIKFAVSVA